MAAPWPVSGVNDLKDLKDVKVIKDIKEFKDFKGVKDFKVIKVFNDFKVFNGGRGAREAPLPKRNGRRLGHPPLRTGYSVISDYPVGLFAEHFDGAECRAAD